MSRSIICFLYKPEDLCLDPQDPCKKPYIMMHVCHADVHRGEGVWGEVTASLVVLASSRFRDRLAQKWKWRRTEEDNFDLWPRVCGQYTIITHTHMHMCKWKILAEGLMLISQKVLGGRLPWLPGGTCGPTVSTWPSGLRSLLLPVVPLHKRFASTQCLCSSAECKDKDGTSVPWVAAKNQRWRGFLSSEDTVLPANLTYSI